MRYWMGHRNTEEIQQKIKEDRDHKEDSSQKSRNLNKNSLYTCYLNEQKLGTLA